MTNDILDVLIKLAPLVNLLVKLEPINAADLPKEHLNELKQLENLGLVYRRNSRSCALQRQRLVRIIERESQYVSALKKEICFSAFAAILQSKENQTPSDSPLPEPAVINALCT